MACITYDTDGPEPQRGHQLQSPGTCYWILSAKPVMARNPRPFRRYKLFVVREHELEESTIALLQRQALRLGDAMYIHPLHWYPRKAKV